MKVYRICRRQYAAFDGEGARRKSGRWNQDGLAVVYTAGSLSLAALEVLVHTDAHLLPADLVYIEAEIPQSIKITSLTPATLPREWQQEPASDSTSTKNIGQAWLSDSQTAILAIPSTIIAIEYNYLLNRAHPEFKKIKANPPINFTFDSRLL